MLLHLTVTDQHGKQVRGRVVYLQPVAERTRQDVAELRITTTDWLAPYYYEIAHSIAAQDECHTCMCGVNSVTGYLVVHKCQSLGDEYLLEGTLYGRFAEP